MKVSVVMAAYNCTQYVAAALHSVTAQTERDLEIILVDDESTDDTLSIARACAEQDKRIRVLTQKHSGTPSVARNFGMRSAAGELITFLDADDLYAPTKISKQLSVFEECPQVDLVFGDAARFSTDFPEGDPIGALREVGFLGRAANYMEQHAGDVYLCKPTFYRFMSTQVTSLATQTVIMRRSVLAREQSWFREDWSVGEDIDLWFRLARHSTMAFVNEVLTYYRVRSGSLMQDSERASMGSIAAHEANLARGLDAFTQEEVSLLRRRLARQYFNLGYLRFKEGRMQGARVAYRRAQQLSSEQYSSLAYWKTFLPAPLLGLLRSSGNAA